MVASITGFSVKAGESNKVFEGLDILGNWTGPIVSCKDGASTLKENNVFRRTHLSPTWAVAAKQPDPLHPTVMAQPKWGFRLFNWKSGQFINVVVEGIWWEHAWYLNVIGDLLLKLCRAGNIGAQGLQVVCRSSETCDPDGWMVVGVHRVEGCNFTMVGLPRGDGRRSYVLSFFGAQNSPTASSPGPRTRWNCTVEVQDTVIDNRAEWTPMLRGAVMAEHRPALHLLGNDISHDGPADRPLVHSFHNDLVVIDRNKFHGAKQINVIEPEEVHITANQGTVPVWITKNGIVQKIGPVNQDWHMAA